MPLLKKKTVVVLEGVCGAEDAEPLLEWLQDRPNGKLNLKRCSHLHTAVLQVLLALRPTISADPEDGDLRLWLTTALGGAFCRE